MKRKTFLYWKRILREYWADWTDVERLCGEKMYGAMYEREN